MSKIDLAAMTKRLNQRIQDDPTITEAGRIRRGLDQIGSRAGIAARAAKSSAEQGAERMRRGLDQIGSRAGIAARAAKSSAEQGAERMRQTATDLTGRAKDINRPPGLDDPVDLGRRRFNRNAAIAAAAAAAPPPLQGAMTRPMTTATLAGANPIKSAALNASFRNLKTAMLRQWFGEDDFEELQQDDMIQVLRYLSSSYNLGIDVPVPEYSDDLETSVQRMQEVVDNAVKQFKASKKFKPGVSPEGRPYVILGDFSNPAWPRPSSGREQKEDTIYRDRKEYQLPRKLTFKEYTITIQRDLISTKNPEPVEIDSDFFEVNEKYVMLNISAAEGTDAISNMTPTDVDNTLDDFVDRALEQGLVVDWSNPNNWVDAYVTDDLSKLKQTGAESVMRYALEMPIDSSIDVDDTSSTVSPVFQNIVGELISQLAGRKIKSMLDQPRSSDSRSEVDDIRTMKDRMDQLDALPAPGQDSEQELADQLTAELQQQLNRDLTAQEEEYVANEVEKYSQ